MSHDTAKQQNKLILRCDYFFFCFQHSLDPSDCCLYFEEGRSKLYFKILDQKQFLRNGVKKHTTLEFNDVTAADLKVTSKFGSWDTMVTRLLVENRTPLTSWRMVRELILYKCYSRN